MARKVITIDGLAGTGKSTLAKWLAEKTNFQFFSSGLIYRAVGKLVLDTAVDPDSEADVLSAIKSNQITIESAGITKNKIYLNGEDISAKIFEPEVSEATSRASQHQAVRSCLLEWQREAFPEHNIIVEGRDMGTVVFPEADLKLFLSCDPEVLIERRYQQFCSNNTDASAQELEEYREKLHKEITERNQRDQQRSVSPTVPAEDAKVIDTSPLTLTKVQDLAYNFARELLS